MSGLAAKMRAAALGAERNGRSVAHVLPSQLRDWADEVERLESQEQARLSRIAGRSVVDQDAMDVPSLADSCYDRRPHVPGPEERYERLEYEPESEPPGWDDLRGRAPEATGGLSSEAFVRELRDAWRSYS